MGTRIVRIALFSRLQDHVEPFSFGEVEAIVAVEVGARLSKAFKEFDSTPMAAASLGRSIARCCATAGPSR